MDSSNLHCRAFQFGEGAIPREIWLGENDHTKPFPGDHGIRFTPRVTSSENGYDLNSALTWLCAVKRLATKLRLLSSSVVLPLPPVLA